MELSKRQQYILEKIVREHVRTARPVSSKQLRRKYALDVKSATIRRDFVQLTEAGYITQPYTSAGRLPTDRGYRFFVDRLQKKCPSFRIAERIAEEGKSLKENADDPLHFFSAITQLLAGSCRSLAASYVIDEDAVSVKAGWSQVARKPEFEDAELVRDFLAMLEQLDERIDRLIQDKERGSVDVFIGRESRMPHSRPFSVIMTCGRYGVFSSAVVLVGPKRMPYPRNMGIMRELSELLEEA